MTRQVGLTRTVKIKPSLDGCPSSYLETIESFAETRRQRISANHQYSTKSSPRHTRRDDCSRLGTQRWTIWRRTWIRHGLDAAHCIIPTTIAFLLSPLSEPSIRRTSPPTKPPLSDATWIPTIYKGVPLCVHHLAYFDSRSLVHCALL